MRNAHSPSQRADTFAGVRRRAWLASTALTVAALATPALADTDWNSGTGNWATNASWTNNAPTAATNITNVSNGNIAQISTAAVAGTNFGSGAHLNVTNGSTVMLLANGSLAVGGFANFNNGTLSLFGSTNVTGGISLANSTISSNVDGTLTSDIASVNGDNRIVAANGTMLTLAPSLAFGVQNASTLHFGTTNNFGTITFEGASNLVTSNTASIAIDGGLLLSSQTPTNHGLEDLTSSVASVTVALGGLLGYRGNLRPDSVTIRDLQGAGTVAVAEGGTGMLGISQGNFSGQIMTADGLRVIGGSSGTLILTGDQTYTGGTVIDADHILQLGDTTATGSIIGDVVNNGRLKFARSATYSFDGVISGSGIVELRNGELALTGTNTYQGGTVIRGGTLVVSRDENLGAASGSITFGGDFAGMKFADNFTSNRDIESNGTIAAGFDTNGHNATLGGVISGPGGLIKDGLGTLTLTNTNTYEGFTEVVKGMLRVNGSIASSHVTVDPDGWLGGTGTVGATDVYGVLAPGNSIGTLTVNGALAFKAGSGSVYFVEMSPTSADRTNATGALTIENSASVNIVHQDGNYVAKRYTIIEAASRTGTFDSLAFVGGDNFGRLVTNPHLEYDATHVYFVLDPAKLTALLPTGATQNQSNLGNAVDRAYGAGGSSPVVGLFGATGSGLVNGLAQASGETATGMQQAGFQSTNYFLTLMLDPFAPTRAGGTFGPAIGYAPEPTSQHPEIAQAYAAAMPTKTPFEQRWSMWAAGYGGQARIQGDANVLGSHDTIARAFGVAGGADYKVSPNTTLGFALAGGATNWGLASSLGTGKSDAFQAGAYASTRAGSAYLSAAAAYALHWASTDRTVTLAGLDRLEASFNAQSFGGRIEGGYRFGAPAFGLTPYAAGQVLGVRTPAYTERATAGTNAFALSYDAKTATTSRSELGLWADSTGLLDAGSTLLLRARAAWAHNFNTDRTINALFQTLPGANFTVGGAAPAVDTVLVSAAAELRMANGWTLGAKFDGEFGAGTQSYAGTGTLRYAW